MTTTPAFPSFPTASQSRIASRNNVLIFNEIRQIELEILQAQTKGQFLVDIYDSYMTLYSSPTSPSVEYWKVWQNLETNPVLTDQMQQVILNFTNLQYSIVQKTNTTTNTTFYWELQW